MLVDYWYQAPTNILHSIYGIYISRYYRLGFLQQDGPSLLCINEFGDCLQLHIAGPLVNGTNL